MLVVQRIGSEHGSAEKLFAHHRHVYAWFTELPMKVGLIADRTERRRMRSTQQCDLSQSPWFLPDAQCFRSDRMAQLQRSSHEAVWEALPHTSGAAFQSRRPGSRAVSIAPLVTFFGMLLAWRRPKIWCSPSWFPKFGMGMQQIIWIYMDMYRDLYIDVAHTWLIM